MKTLVGLFDRKADAIEAVAELEARHIPPEDISIVSNHADGWYDDSGAEAGAEAGAGVGAALGSLGGLLAGLGVITVPGIGPLVSAGWLLSTLAGGAAGAIIGGAAGSLVGALTEHGIDDHEAEIYAESLKRGGTLVVVKVEQAFIPAAEAILIKHRVDIAARRDLYADEGWTRFDDHVPPSGLQPSPGSSGTLPAQHGR